MPANITAKEEIKEDLYTDIIHDMVAKLEETFIKTFDEHFDKIDDNEYHEIICNALAQFVLSTVAQCSGGKTDKILASVQIMTQLLTELTPHYTGQGSAPTKLGKLH